MQQHTATTAQAATLSSHSLLSAYVPPTVALLLICTHCTASFICLFSHLYSACLLLCAASDERVCVPFVARRVRR